MQESQDLLGFSLFLMQFDIGKAFFGFNLAFSFLGDLRISVEEEFLGVDVGCRDLHVVEVVVVYASGGF